MVKLRLKRLGRKNRPSYRIIVVDSRARRDAAAIEELGHYDPLESEADKQLKLNAERAQYWLSVGAKPSETVERLLRRCGVAVEHK